MSDNHPRIKYLGLLSVCIFPKFGEINPLICRPVYVCRQPGGSLGEGASIKVYTTRGRPFSATKSLFPYHTLISDMDVFQADWREKHENRGNQKPPTLLDVWQGYLGEEDESTVLERINVPTIFHPDQGTLTAQFGIWLKSQPVLQFFGFSATCLQLTRALDYNRGVCSVY